MAVTTTKGLALLIGGRTTAANQPTAIVESMAWEPAIERELEPGYYVTQVAGGAFTTDGVYSLRLESEGPLDGGLNLGGLLSARGVDAAFGAFFLEGPQAVTASIQTQAATASASGPLEFTVRILDGNRRIVATTTGAGQIRLSQDLAPGFYVYEIRASERAPAMTFQASLSGPQFGRGGISGAVIRKGESQGGFQGFYLTTRQKVRIQLYNESTIGEAGAGELILSLVDSRGQVLERSGPGAGLKSAPYKPLSTDLEWVPALASKPRVEVVER